MVARMDMPPLARAGRADAGTASQLIPGVRRTWPDKRERNMQKPASLFSLVIFWLIALLQLLRIVFQVRVTAGGVEIPIWARLFPALFFAVLGAWLWAERRG
jgi:hypothetical protein